MTPADPGGAVLRVAGLRKRYGGTEVVRGLSFEIRRGECFGLLGPNGTTVMTILDRLVRRGAVERKKDGRAFVYAAVLEREHARKLAVKELVDTYFNSSMQALRSYLDHQPAVPEPHHAETHAAHATLDTTLL